MATFNRVRRSVATPGSAAHRLLTLEAPPWLPHPWPSWRLHWLTSLTPFIVNSFFFPFLSRRSGLVLITPVRTLQAHLSIHRFFINGYASQSRLTVDYVTLWMLHLSLPPCALSFGAYMPSGWMHTTRASYLCAYMHLSPLVATVGRSLAGCIFVHYSFTHLFARPPPRLLIDMDMHPIN